MNFRAWRVTCIVILEVDETKIIAVAATNAPGSSGGPGGSHKDHIALLMQQFGSRAKIEELLVFLRSLKI